MEGRAGLGPIRFYAYFFVRLAVAHSSSSSAVTSYHAGSWFKLSIASARVSRSLWSKGSAFCEALYGCRNHASQYVVS